MSIIPDVIRQTGIWVHGTDSAHGAGWGAVFGNVHVVSCPGEPRRFVCIQHRYSDGSAVFNRSSTQEARVHGGIQDLHRERVGTAAFIVYGLERENECGYSGWMTC